MALTLSQELSEQRTRIRKLQMKILKRVGEPKYYSTLSEMLGLLVAADVEMARAEIQLRKLIGENSALEG